MKREGPNLVLGLVLVGLGVLSLLGRIGLDLFLGRALVAAIGLLFLALYLVGGAPWALYPGAFVTPVGGVVYLAASGWNMSIYWPLFVIAPGIGFLIVKTMSPDARWAVLPGTIITASGAIMFLFSSGTVSWLYFDVIRLLWPVGLILLGLYLLVAHTNPPWKKQN